MIDAEPVVEVGRSPGSLLQPLVSAALNHFPSIERQPPVLAGRRERVGWRSDRCVQAKLVLARPHVSAVRADDKWKISEDGNGPGILTSATPLLVGDPLQPPAIWDFFFEPLLGVSECTWFPVADSVAPLQPIASTVVVVERAEQRVIGEPPRLAVPECLELARTR